MRHEPSSGGAPGAGARLERRSADRAMPGIFAPPTADVMNPLARFLTPPPFPGETLPPHRTWAEAPWGLPSGQDAGLRSARLHRKRHTVAVDSNVLEAKSREGAGKGQARRLRAQGLVPAVVYGPHLEKPAHLAV